MLDSHREELLRRALALAVSRSSLDELAERPLATRLDELELLFEAAAADAGRRGRCASHASATFARSSTTSSTSTAGTAASSRWR